MRQTSTQPTLRTERLTLTPMEDAALDSLIAAEEDNGRKRAFSDMQQGAKEHPESRLWFVPWRMRLKDGTDIGCIWFKGIPLQRTVGLDYALKADYLGNGFAAEAVEEAIQWAFRQKDVLFITAEADEPAAVRVLEKCNFKPDEDSPTPRLFVREKKIPICLSLGMCIGMCIGMAIGVALDNMGTGMTLGMLSGLGFGGATDATIRRRRAGYRKERKGEKIA